jgi:GNAT superfamily N-acetyltransferase
MTVHAAPGAAPIRLAPATDEDFEALLSLRMAAMRESLQRLGRFDPQRARERLSRAFEPAHTRLILQGGERVGFVVLLPVPARWPDHLVLDHLYIAPQAQGQGVGSWVMAQVLDEADRLQLPVRVTALKLSDANRFYQRHGFELQHQSEWDLHYVRPAADDRLDDRSDDRSGPDGGGGRG